MPVDLDALLVVELDARLVEAEVVGVGAAADGDEHLVGGNSSFLPSRSAVSTPLA
jgi:hypothetical protein